MESVTLQFELYQLINEPTHLWGDTHMMSTLRGEGGRRDSGIGRRGREALRCGVG